MKKYEFGAARKQRAMQSNFAWQNVTVEGRWTDRRIPSTVQPVISKKNSIKRKFSRLRASRVATTAPIALVREFIL